MTLVLAAAALPAAAAHAEPLPKSTLERGDRGPDVRTVQRALTRLRIRTARDGVFGRATERSVRRYERRFRIRVDGEVSRGQARGLFKRAGIRVTGARPRRALQSSASAPGSPFPIRGAWRLGGDGAYFGDRGGRHKGEDIFADCGTPLIAPEGGRVVFTGSHSAAGHYVVVRTPGGEDHVFMHLQRAAPVDKGDRLDARAVVGKVGRTGNATACHLHFEIWTAPGWYEGGRARDPRPDLQAWANAT